ncbi:MAG TPA: helix-turn-helix transcriptional regulator [Thermoanaerobaculia bacterium]|nr:helix-turn-helix transcriptional regulator [Thermoanaerobaculia bacterium]
MDDQDFLRAFGERLRGERARRGMSRKLLAGHAGISERYVTQIESGKGNVSIAILRQIAAALGLPLTRLVEEETGSEMALLRQFLVRLTPAQMTEAHAVLAARFASQPAASRSRRIALIGLRGAGKTTLGTAMAGALRVPFFELDREIERLAGTTLGALIELYGQQASRRDEAQALEDLLERHPQFVVAAGGGIVSETATYEMLLRHCLTVWVRARPEDHMARVIAQGDLRPMAGSTQAMEDLRRILEERTPLYARADITIETSGNSEAGSLQELLAKIPRDGTEL